MVGSKKRVLVFETKDDEVTPCTNVFAMVSQSIPNRSETQQQGSHQNNAQNYLKQAEAERAAVADRLN